MGSFYRDIYGVNNTKYTVNKKENKPESYKWYEIALGYSIMFAAIGALPFIGDNREYSGIKKNKK